MTQTPPHSPAIKSFQYSAILILCVLTYLLLYTSLHEAGHALAGVLFAAKITDFSVNFFDLSAHVGLDGIFTPMQHSIVNSAGMALPVLIWFVTILLVPKNLSLIGTIAKTMVSFSLLSTLLVWIVIPILYLAGNAPAGDDVTQFIYHSGISPLLVSFMFTLLFAGGWLLFVFRTRGLRQAFALWLEKWQAINQTRRIFAVVVIISITVIGFLAIVSAGNTNRFNPPEGYTKITSINLNKSNYENEILFKVTLPEKNTLGIIVQVDKINTPFMDISLFGTDGSSQVILHGETYWTDFDIAKAQYINLPAGEYKVVLNSRQSPGKLTLYLNKP
jgi:hypothetical protein